MIQAAEIVKLGDLHFEPFLMSETIDEAVQKIAGQINRDYNGEEVLLIGVLNGAFVFMNELIKQLEVSLEIDFIKVSSYDGMNSSGELALALDFKNDIKGKNVILIEDIIDTGLTASRLLKMASCLRPRSLKIASLLLKPDSLKTQVQMDYVGIEIPDVFVVGYGLDYDQKGRELPMIYKLYQED
ncbi:MAG: hypoxanthine phosphoribosyltransferase [Bacteroidia bacterium]|nr:hypoxanthine phosphoribosyltransferase [Bacteroidia bacterium]